MTLHNGSKIVLTKMAEDYNPTDKLRSLQLLHETATRDEFATGILYVEPDKQDFIDLLGLVDEPLASSRRVEDAAGQSGARRDHGELQIDSRISALGSGPSRWAPATDVGVNRT